MSANICWRPVTANKNSLGVNYPSNFIDSLEEAFGVFPVKLSHEEVPILKGMVSVKSTKSNNCKQYKKIIDLITELGEIEIFAEY